MNGLTEILLQSLHSYLLFYFDFFKSADYLPAGVRPLFFGAVILGVLVPLFKNFRTNVAVNLVSAALLLTLPIALRLTYVINDEAWIHAGRIVGADGYLCAFSFCVLLQCQRLRFLVRGLTISIVYIFFLVAIQESHTAALRNIFEIEKMGRITARIEQAAPDLFTRSYHLVVVGELPFDGFATRKFRNSTYSSQFQTEPFAAYRQPEMINFFLGRSALGYPTESERQNAVYALGQHHAWPAPDSVFVLDNSIVVNLGPYKDMKDVTWAR